MRLFAVINGLLVLFLVAAAMVGGEGVVRNERLGEELARLQRLNDELGADNRRLREEIHALRHDGAFVEHVIRDELGWVRPDEMVFIFPSAKQ